MHDLGTIYNSVIIDHQEKKKIVVLFKKINKIINNKNNEL